MNEQMMTCKNTLQVLLQGMVSRGVRSAHIGADGHLLFYMTDGAVQDLGIVSRDGGGLYLVTVTEGDDGSYAADRGYGEILDAIDAGRMVMVKLTDNSRGSFYGVLTACVPDMLLRFGCWQFTPQQDLSFVVTLYPDGSVKLSVPDRGEEAVPCRVSAVRDAGEVTVTAEYDDGSIAVSVIALDDNGDPISVTKDGVTCALSWEGFDES